MKKDKPTQIEKEMEQIQKDIEKGMDDVFRSHKKAFEYLAKR